MVFKATHLEMNRPVALKTLLPQAAMESVEVERFRQEAVLASSLTHPNTITLFDYGQTEDGVFYLVMEYLRGETLKERLQRTGHMTPEVAQKIVTQVLKSLAEAHNLGIVHRDLKPENIFLSEMPGEHDFVKVLDFGVAKMMGGDNQADPNADLSMGATFGTPRYMAPEQITGQPVAAHTDIYALGLIAYELVTGHPAVNGRTPLEIITNQVHHQAPRLPDALRMTPIGRLIEGAIVKEPGRRPQHATAALELLHQAASTATYGGIDAIPTAGWSSIDLAAVDPASSLLHNSGASGRYAATSQPSYSATPSHPNMPVAFSAAAQGSFMSEATFEGDFGDGFEDDGATRVQDSSSWLAAQGAAPMGDGATTVRPRPTAADDDGATRIRPRPTAPDPVDHSAYMAETPMADFGDGFDDDDATRVRQPYASEPTQMVAVDDIIDGQQLDGIMSETPMQDFDDAFDSAPTRVAEARIDPKQAVAATMAAKRAAQQRRPVQASNKILDTESTDPEMLLPSKHNGREAVPAPQLNRHGRARTPEPEPQQPVEPEEPEPLDRSVLFSVGAGAGYVGPEHNVPGTDGYTEPIHHAKASHTPTVFPPPAGAPDSGSTSRRLLLAMAVLVLGVLAMMLVIVVFLLLPEGDPASSPPPIAVAENSASVAPDEAKAPDEAPANSAAGDDTASDSDKATDSDAAEQDKAPDEVAAKSGADDGAQEDDTKEEGAADDAAKEEEAKPAILTVTSKPEGASVYIDGRFAGLAPVELKQPDSDGTVTLLVKKDGYVEENSVIQYNGSREVEVELKSTAVAQKDAPKRDTAKEEAARKAAADKAAADKEAARKAAAEKEAARKAAAEKKAAAAKTTTTKKTTTTAKKSTWKPPARNTKKKTTTKKKKDAFGKW